MSTLILYATGHRRLYSSDEDEVRAISRENARQRGGGLGTIDPEDPSLNWWPSSLDFQTEARRHTRHPIDVGSFQQFLGAIRRRRNLETVLFFGHGGRNLLKFGDTNYIRSNNIQGTNNDLSSHFAQNGRIILYACNAAHSPEFLSALANSLHVTVCGFRSGVRWNLRWDGTTPDRRITWRGIRRGSSAGDSLPSGYQCSSPRIQLNNSVNGEQHSHFLRRGVMIGANNRTGQIRGGSRHPRPTGLA